MKKDLSDLEPFRQRTVKVCGPDTMHMVGTYIFTSETESVLVIAMRSEDMEWIYVMTKRRIRGQWRETKPTSKELQMMAVSFWDPDELKEIECSDHPDQLGYRLSRPIKEETAFTA